MLNRKISVAPMMDWTDRHCRFFHRLLSPNALLYSEMIHANAINMGDAARHLYFRTEEQPVALQLGGIEAKALADAAKRGEEFGYREINLNCGCPSDRVQAGAFGACLMAEPQRVADAVAAMRDAVSIPVTVKTRIGIDDQDSYEFLCTFIEIVHTQGGCDVFVLHARKAWLKGLSPKENRSIPPLHWDRVHQVKRDYPQLEILTNGGFENLADISEQLHHVDGVMVGRKAYHEPYFLAQMEQAFFQNQVVIAATEPQSLDLAAINTNSPTTPGWRVKPAMTNLPSRESVVERMIVYMQEEQKTRDVYIKNISRHMLGLYHAQPVSKKWKNALMDAAKANSTKPVESFLNSIL